MNKTEDTVDSVSSDNFELALNLNKAINILFFLNTSSHVEDFVQPMCKNI